MEKCRGYALGLDVGTTAVKCALVDAATRRVVATGNSAIHSDIQRQRVAGHAEQSVEELLMATEAAMRQLPLPKLQQVTSVGLCGQMHGIVWWRAAEVGQRAASLLRGTDSDSEVTNANGTNSPWSALITWEDQRCSTDFLANCDRQVASCGKGEDDVLISPLSSGYGLASFAYTMAHTPQDLDGYDTCGTIQDLLAFVICGHSVPAQASIDTTNGFSWGGFDLTQKTWHFPSVEALGIPVHLLPSVHTPGSVIGHVPIESLFRLPAGASVYVPMGDHPCSVVAAIAQQSAPQDAVKDYTLVNIGTSAQMAMLLSEDELAQLPPIHHRSFEIRPYVNVGEYIGVAAALSGGNMVAWLVERCKEWMQELGAGASSMNARGDSAIYERLFTLGLQHLDTELEFRPTLNGERADPMQRGAIHGLGLHSGSMGDVAAALCRGVITNLADMVPDPLKHKLEATRMIGTGNALLRNPLLQYFLRHDQLVKPELLILQDAADAAVGAALVSIGPGRS